MKNKNETTNNENILDEERRNVDELLSIRYIKKGDATFERTPGGFVSMKLGDDIYPRIALHRTFPFTDPDKYISIREPDAKAREIGIIENLSDMPEDVQTMLGDQMNMRYFAPIIERIENIKEEYGYAYWNVVTDRGACRFTVSVGGGGNVARVSDTHVVILDIDGNRFEIPDIEKLSHRELKKLDLYI